MGLDVSHDCWHGAYSAFHRFREHIAEAIGLNLNYMQGFYDNKKPDYMNMGMKYALQLEETVDKTKPRWEAKIPGQSHEVDKIVLELVTINKFLPLKWDMFKPDPLFKLLYHSDCEGTITRRYQLKIAQRLEEIAPLLPTEGGGHLPNPREAALQFARGLREAYEAREVVEFH